MNKKIGIYKIINIINQKIYIGSSNNIKRRKYEHYYELRKKRHGNQKLQNSFNKYGEESFKFEIIEECTKEELIIREQYYIDTLSPWFNISKIANSALGNKHTEETKLKISAKTKGLKRSKEFCELMKIKSTGNKNNIGKHHSIEAKKKMSDNKKNYYKNLKQKENTISTTGLTITLSATTI